MSVLLGTNSAQLLLKPLFPSSSPPLLHLWALTTPVGAHLKGFLSQKRFSLRLYKPQVISMPLHPSVSLSLSVVSWFRFTPVPRYICLCLETGGASSSAIRRGGLRAEMPAVRERKVRLPADTVCHFRTG